MAGKTDKKTAVEKPTANKEKHILSGIKYNRKRPIGSNDLPINEKVGHSVDRGGVMVRVTTTVENLVNNPIVSLKVNPKWAGIRFDVTAEQMEYITKTDLRTLKQIETKIKDNE